MRQRIIAIDADDVLFDTSRRFTALSNEWWGTSLTPEQYTEDWCAFWGVSPEEVDERAKRYHQPGIVSSYEPMPGAQVALRAIKRMGFNLAVATSREAALKAETQEGIRRYFGSLIAKNEIWHDGNWDGVVDHQRAQTKTKAKLYTEIGASYAIDDQPKHCLAAAELGMSAVMLDIYGRNREVELPSGIVRAESWAEAEEFFYDESGRGFYAKSA